MPVPECSAGRTSFFGGKWTEPCVAVGRHAIGSPDKGPIRLCDEHFRQVNEAGLVNEPYIGEKEFQKRERAKKSWLNRFRSN